MSEFIAIAFDGPTEADETLTRLQRLQREYLVDLEDAVVVIRDADGKVHLKQNMNLVGVSAGSGALTGALWGSLVGLLFLNPLAGMVVGGAVGAGSGALAASLVDYGIDDNLIREIGQTIKPDSSALFLLVRKAQPEKVLAELGDVHGRIIRSSLSTEAEQKLQAAISKMRETPAAAPAPVSPAADQGGLGQQPA